MNAFLKRNWIPLLSLVLVLGYVLWQRMPQHMADRELLGKISPDLVLEKSGSKDKLRLHDLHGKKVLLYFFATWCGACKLQAVSIEKISKENKDQNFHLLAISEESSTVLRDYQKEKQLHYPIFRDTQGQAHSHFQIKSYPTVVWIESNGKIKDIGHGLNLLLPYSVRHWLKGSFFAL